MDYECINPECREWIRLLVLNSPEEIALSELGYAEMCECRLHWNCCPSCRRDFPTLPIIAQQAGRDYEELCASDLALCRDNFEVKKDLFLRSGGEDAYVKLIVDLAEAEFDVHDGLRRALMVSQNLQQGREIEYDPYKREILSECQKFVSSLDPGVQHFVVAATLCFELLRPMWEKVGLSPRFDSRSQEQIFAEVMARLARIKSGEQPNDPGPPLGEKLRVAISESGLEPRILWELIEAAAECTSGRAVSGIDSLIERKFRELDDDVDSLKAAQMALIRISEHSSRKAEDYEPDVASRIGQPLYSQLTEMTRRLLTVAEYLYQINSQDPNHFDGPIMKMAIAYENELRENVVIPVLRDMLASGVQHYGSSDEPLITQGGVHNALTTGTIARYLRKDADFARKIRARGLNPEAIMKDAYDVKRYRDRAAHDMACERAVAEDLRGRILRPDGVLSRLHCTSRSR